MKFKISGQSLELPEGTQWKFKSRPGGWWIAERKRADGTTERKRFMGVQSGLKVWLQTQGKSMAGEIIPTPSHGELLETSSPNSDLTAQFPGKVRKVLVRPGQKVKRGENLVLIEAMKMEFTIRAPSDGSVDGILVTDGQQLSPGTQLIEFSEDRT